MPLKTTIDTYIIFLRITVYTLKITNRFKRILKLPSKQTYKQTNKQANEQTQRDRQTDRTAQDRTGQDRNG